MDKKFMVFDGKKDFDPCNFKTKIKDSGFTKKTAAGVMGEKMEIMRDLQSRLFAYHKHSLLIIIQAMDAGGKDGLVKNVMDGTDPHGVDVYSFKKPTETELDHDYMWRCIKCLPEKGKIGIFNRSYYEDVLISHVHNLPYNQNLPKRCLGEDLWKNRYRQIRDFERYFTENGITVLKFFLYISKDEQKERFLERIENKDKNWKFAHSDIEERKFWDKYMTAYKNTINETSSENAPWFVIPSDSKWYARLAVMEFIIEALEKINPQYPAVGKKESESLLSFRDELLNE